MCIDSNLKMSMQILSRLIAPMQLEAACKSSTHMQIATMPVHTLITLE